MTSAPPNPPPALVRFNSLPEAEARTLLLACCASPTWAQRVLAGRPYATAEELVAAAAEACGTLTDADVDEALAAHPRIGDRAEGEEQEARWSRQEQASVADADARLQEQLRAGNVRYEERFGRVFLIRAAGRAPEDVLAELQRRLGNDPEAERREVREQLCQITRLRAEQLVAS